MVFFITMCIPWESNPQPFALLTQCSTTEPQEHSIYVSRYNMHLDIICFNNGGMIFKHISDILIYITSVSHTLIYLWRLTSLNKHEHCTFQNQYKLILLFSKHALN